MARCSGMLLQRPDVVRQRIAAARGDPLAGLDESEDELGELARALGKVRERPRLVHVDAHADVEVQGRLLVVSDYPPVRRLDDPELEVDALAAHRDGQQRLLLTV